MFEKIDTKKIDKLIKDKFSIIYDYDFEGLVLLYGGAVKDTIIDEEVKDLDFVILSQNKDKIKDFISKYKLKYRKNDFGGYKIKYKGFEIDMCTTDDLLDVATYDIDLLFYDIEKHMLILCGPSYSYEKRIITEINNERQVFNIKRLKKLINHIKKVTGSNKRVSVKINIFRIIYRKIKKEIRNIKR